MHTIHPAESFAGNKLEVDPLVSIFGIDEMREFDGIKLFKGTLVKLTKYHYWFDLPSPEQRR